MLAPDCFTLHTQLSCLAAHHITRNQTLSLATIAALKKLLELIIPNESDVTDGFDHTCVLAGF